eukprot:4923049-Amphidinium_carterae.1
MPAPQRISYYGPNPLSELVHPSGAFIRCSRWLMVWMLILHVLDALVGKACSESGQAMPWRRHVVKQLKRCSACENSQLRCCFHPAY